MQGIRTTTVLALAILLALPWPAQAQDLQAAEQAYARNDAAAVIQLLLPSFNAGRLTDARALYLLSRACLQQKPSLRFALDKAGQCNNRTGRITWAAADAGSVDAMLDLAVTLDTDLGPLRHPDLRQDRAAAYRAALLASRLATDERQRERARKALSEITPRLRTAARDRVDAEVAAYLGSAAGPGAGTTAVAASPGSARSGTAADWVPRPSSEGPFGLRFGMSEAEVTLKRLESDKYGRDSLSSPNKHYSCLDTMTFPFNGSYTTRNLSEAQRAHHLAMRQRWLDALAHTEPEAAGLAQTLKTGVVERLGWNFAKEDSALSDVAVRAYATGSGTTVCAAFFQDRLFRVTANLSGKRDLIPALLEKLQAEHAGAPYEYWPRTGDSRRIYTHRWAAHPEGVWVTVHHEDYERPKNVDWSRAYDFGGMPDFPTPAQLPAEADYLYPPILAQALVWHARRKAQAAEQRQQQKATKTREALDEF